MDEYVRKDNKTLYDRVGPVAGTAVILAFAALIVAGVIKLILMMF